MGSLLPLAGHKGYGIATMMDVLSGILGGGQFGAAVVGPYEPEGRSGVGHLAIALDIESFRPLEAFAADMESLIEGIKGGPRAAGVEEIFYPGEPEALADQRNRREGLVIPDDTLAELDAAARDLGIATLGDLAR